MVQAYHAVPVSVEHEDLDDGRGAEHEGSALLGGKASSVGLAKNTAEKGGRATLTSSVSNLANTIIGSGACAVSFSYHRFLQRVLQACSHSLGYVPMAYSYFLFNCFVQAFASAGIIPGVLTCLFSGTVGAFGLYLLSACARKAPHRRSSFFAIATLTFPRAAVFFDAAIAIKCFGVSIRCATLPTRPPIPRLMQWTVILSSSSRSFQVLSRHYTTTLHPQIPIHQTGHLAGACGSVFSWSYLCRYRSFVV